MGCLYLMGSNLAKGAFFCVAVSICYSYPGENVNEGRDFTGILNTHE